VGFVVSTKKKKEEHEIARWRYCIKLDVEETAEKARQLGFVCRSLEGQPKNKKGKDGWGEDYPLNQYEITGFRLPKRVKIHLAPKATQIFILGKIELPVPSEISNDKIVILYNNLEKLLDELEDSEKVLNEISVFTPDEKNRFSQSSRIYSKIPSMFRLIISSNDAFQYILNRFEQKGMEEIRTIWIEILQGNVVLAKSRLEALNSDITYCYNDILNFAKEWNDPRVKQWEEDFKEAQMFPFKLNGNCNKKE
jgi:hypothetical protein